MSEHSNYLQTFLDYLSYEADASPLTVGTYQADLQSYLAYVEERLGEAFVPSEGDLDLVRGWLSHKMDQGVKASTVGRCLTSLKSYYRYLLKTERIKTNPIQALRPPKAAKPLPVYVPTEEMDQMLSPEIDEHDWRAVRDRLILVMLYECGLRRSELAGLKEQAVDTQARQLKVLGKGRKERIVPFGEGLASSIEAWRHLRTSVFGLTESFLVNTEGKAMTPQAVYAVAHEALSAVPNLARRGAHVLRHTFATDMLNSGADLMLLKELLGHNSVSTTVRYTHTSFEQLKKLYAAHPRAVRTPRAEDTDDD